MICYKLLKSNNFLSYIPGIIELFRLCFTAPISDGVLKWRYAENPYKDLNAVIALDGNKIVGFIGTISNEVYYYGSKIKAAMFTNMMTNPNYSGCGIFTNMLNMLENELAKEGYEFIYSLPNNLSNHILIDRLYWKDIYEIPRLELSCETCSLNRDFNPKSRIDCVLSDPDFLMDYSGVESMRGEKHFSNTHTRCYLKWRIRDNPEHC